MISKSLNPEEFLKLGSSYLTPINLSEFSQLKGKLMNKYFHEKHQRSKNSDIAEKRANIDDDDNLLKEIFSKSYILRHQMTKMCLIANYRKIPVQPDCNIRTRSEAR